MSRFVDIDNLLIYKNKIIEIQNEIAKVPPHCQRCGDTQPKHGFYPLFIGGNLIVDNQFQCRTTSDLLCNRCALNDENYLKTFGEEKEIVD